MSQTSKRTDIDFSKHELNIIWGHEIVIHDLKIPGSVIDRVTFSNNLYTDNLTVTGDYSRWSFNRAFIPDAEGSVSDSYWNEKLSLGYGYQSDPAQRYCKKKTRELLKESLEEFLEDIDEGLVKYADELLKDGMFFGREFPGLQGHHDLINDYAKLDTNADYYENYVAALGETEFEWEYYSPQFKMPPHLEVIYDAFDEVCNRIKENPDKHER